MFQSTDAFHIKTQIRDISNQIPSELNDDDDDDDDDVYFFIFFYYW
jgi:hypothetical protein